MIDRESAEKSTRLDIPDSDIVAIVFKGEIFRALWVTVLYDYGPLRPRNDVLLPRRKVNQEHEWMTESLKGFIRGSTPQAYALLMQCGKISSEGRPGNV
jgi:hypothetical protein